MGGQMTPEEGPLRLYLDTNQWNFLMVHPRYSTDQLAEARKKLRRKVRSHEIEVIGSLPLAQELTGAQFKKPDKYAAMVRLALEVIEARWLLPLNERHRAEGAHGGLVPEPQCYLATEMLARIRPMLTDAKEADEIALETLAEVRKFKDDQEQLRQQSIERLTSEGAEDVGETLAAWLAEVDFDQWVRDIVDDGGKLGHPSIELSDDVREHLPSTWCFVAYKLARIKMNLGDQDDIKRSDYIDAEHVGAAPYCDILVTDDAELVRTLRLLPPITKVENFSWLMKRMGA